MLKQLYDNSSKAQFWSSQLHWASEMTSPSMRLVSPLLVRLGLRPNRTM
jgi:hypothetical protein